MLLSEVEVLRLQKAFKHQSSKDYRNVRSHEELIQSSFQRNGVWSINKIR